MSSGSRQHFPAKLIKTCIKINFDWTCCGMLCSNLELSPKKFNLFNFDKRFLKCLQIFENESTSISLITLSCGKKVTECQASV